jgi:integrase
MDRKFLENRLYEVIGACNDILRYIYEDEKIISNRFKVYNFSDYIKPAEFPPKNLSNTETIAEPTDKSEDTMPKYSDGTFRKKYKNGLLEYRFYIESKLVSVYGHSKEECFNKRTELIKGDKKRKNNDVTFKEWLIFWYKTYKENKLAEKTKLQLENQINSYIVPELGEMLLKKITGEDLQKFLNKFTDRPNTQKKLYNVLNPSLEKAKRLGKIKLNPMEDVEVTEHESEHYRALEFTEQTLILENANSQYRPVIKIFMCTGIRLSRLFALDVSDIDFENGYLTVFKKQKKGLNKTYSVPFLPQLFDNFKVPKHGKLFGELTLEAFRTYIKKLYKNLNIKGANIHSFRHTFISILYNIGCPIKKIQLWAGHSTFQMTTDIYLHLLKKGDSEIKTYLTALNDNF